MKKLLTLTLLTIATACFGQAIVNLGNVTLTSEQVTVMTWHWQNYTNATAAFNADTNNTPVPVLNKAQWFVFECTNLVLFAVNRKVVVYDQIRKQALLEAYTTNATKRAQIDAILISP